MPRKKLSSEDHPSAGNWTDWTPKKEAFLKAFELTVANVKEACKKVGISRQTYYNWLETDATFSKAVANVREGIIDDTESALFKSIGQGNVTAIIFALKCRGKSRGYVERQELVEVPAQPCACKKYKSMSREELMAEWNRRKKLREAHRTSQ